MLDVYELPDGWLRLVAGHSQAKPVRKPVARISVILYVCTYVKHSTLSSAIEQVLRDRRVADRANATSSA